MLILLVLVSISLTTYGLNVGDECQSGLSTYPAKCVPHSFCKLQEWTIENMKNEICGFQGEPFSMSVCCPTQLLSSNFTTSAPTNFTTVQKESFIVTKSGRKVMYNSQITGSLAKAKCAENAEIFDEINRCKCGNTDRCPFKRQNTNIHVTIPKAYPHIAIFGYGNEDDDIGNSDNIKWNCGGNLISDNVILTAAHCTTTEFGAPKWAGFGIEQCSGGKAPEEILDIEEIIIHPEYNSSHKKHDIAIVRLEEKVCFNEWAKPACLSTNWYNLENNNINKAILTGWGPQKVDLIITHSAEIVHYGTCGHIQDEEHPIYFGANETTCTTNPFESCGQSLCLIDSNKDDECMYDVIGISNEKLPCSKYFRQYTHINRYMNWIEKTAWPEYF